MPAVGKFTILFLVIFGAPVLGKKEEYDTFKEPAQGLNSKQASITITELQPEVGMKPEEESFASSLMPRDPQNYFSKTKEFLSKRFTKQDTLQNRSITSKQQPVLEEIPSVTFQNSRTFSFKPDQSWRRGLPVAMLPSQSIVSVIRSPKCKSKPEFSIADSIKNIVMIPGSGEFVYDTMIQEKRYQVQSLKNQYVSYGNPKTINQHSNSGKSDAMVSLDQLKSELPNVEWVSVVVNWFASSLNIKDCKIYPAVEFQNEYTATEEWQVGDVKRVNARQISKIKGRNLRYGGTVSDAVLIRYIDELHRRGYKVMLYPTLLLDTKNREWRSRLTGTPKNIRSFFSDQYNPFIKHYSIIAKRTKAEGFVIGSELVGLTAMRDTLGNYPVVSELVDLAKQVKSLLGRQVTVTYAAYWSEYHSYSGWYFMDELWTSDYIDVVGINAYFPLTDGPEPPAGYTVQDVVNGWSSGEGYSYYLDYSKDPPEKMRYSDSKWPEWKNIEKWWSEPHIYPDSSQTAWRPKMKKIWFTEFGFPSVDGCTNEPYIFVDKECRYPRYSNKEVSFRSQKNAIEGTLRKWRDSEAVERMFLYAWDARPYPAFPNSREVWGDCGNWEAGYWIQGKIGKSLEPKKEVLPERGDSLPKRAQFDQHSLKQSQLRARSQKESQGSQKESQKESRKELQKEKELQMGSQKQLQPRKKTYIVRVKRPAQLFINMPG